MLSSFTLTHVHREYPSPIIRSVAMGERGREVILTEILLDKSTSREDLIQACQFLAEEEVQLTFESLEIRKPFLGVLGSSRIAYARGKIALPTGVDEPFEAGGIMGFRSIKIIYSRDTQTNNYAINTVEIIE